MKGRGGWDVYEVWEAERAACKAIRRRAALQTGVEEKWQGYERGESVVFKGHRRKSRKRIQVWQRRRDMASYAWICRFEIETGSHHGQRTQYHRFKWVPG